MNPSKMKILSSALAAFATLVIAPATCALAANPAGSGLPSALLALKASSTTDRIIVRYRDDAGSRKSAAAATKAGNHVYAMASRRGLTAKHLRVTGVGAQVWSLGRRVSEADAQALAEAIAAADPEVEYAQADRSVQLAAAPNDPRYSSQWGLKATPGGVNAEAAWNTTTGAGVVVAVVDTGYRPHSDLNIQPGVGYDFVTDSSSDGDLRDADPTDPGSPCTTMQNQAWHGTHIAGIIAARTNNGVGVAGVAPGVTIVPVRVLGGCQTYESDVVDGVLWASGNAVLGAPANPTPARVINLSLGFRDWNYTCKPMWVSAIAAAKGKGAVIVASAGNDGIDLSNNTPANCPGVIRVTGITAGGYPWSISSKDYNYSPTSQLTLAAPADGILSTTNSGTTTPVSEDYGTMSGTSMAAAHVSGVAALAISVRPALTAAQVEQILRVSVRPFPSPADCQGCGAGITDAPATVSNALIWPTMYSYGSSRTGSGTVSINIPVAHGGDGPFLYTWSKSGSFNMTSTSTSPTVTISEFLEVCGSMASAQSNGEVHVSVRDGYGNVRVASSSVKLTAYRRSPATICR